MDKSDLWVSQDVSQTGTESGGKLDRQSEVSQTDMYSILPLGLQGERAVGEAAARR